MYYFMDHEHLIHEQVTINRIMIGVVISFVIKEDLSSPVTPTKSEPGLLELFPIKSKSVKLVVVLEG